MNNRIRKVDSSATPKQARAFVGPATCGIEYDKASTVGAVVLTPDSNASRLLPPVLQGSGAPSGTTGQNFMAPGSFYFDTTGKFLYMNVGTMASPSWVEVDSQRVNLGASASFGTVQGIASSQFSAAGNGNGADATNDVLFTFALPANTLSANGKSIIVEAWGQTTNSATNKVAALYFGQDAQTVGSAIVTTATAQVIASGNIGNGTAVGWYMWMQIKRTSSGNQIIGSLGQTGTTAITFAVPAATTRTDSGALSVTVTGSDSGSVASRCLCNSFDVYVNN